MSAKSLLWKIPSIVIGGAVGLVLLLIVSATVVIVTPPLRQAVVHKVLEKVSEQTGLEMDVEKLDVSVFHQSPMVLYQAYKGERDFPLSVAIDSLFVGHRGQDTLIYVHSLRLKANIERLNDLLASPIVVEELRLDDVTFHSDSMIAGVGVDAIVKRLHVKSPELNIAEGKFPLHDLDLANVFVGIDLRETAEVDTAAQDTTPLKLAFDIPNGKLRHIRFALNPIGLDIRTRYLATKANIDVGANRYDVRKLDIGDLKLGIGELELPFDKIYGNADVDIAHNVITSSGLHARSEEFGAKADLSMTRFDLGSMRVDVVGDADYQGSQAHLCGYYGIDDSSYDMQVQLEHVDLGAILDNGTQMVLAGDISAKGKGIDIHSPAMRTAVELNRFYAKVDGDEYRVDELVFTADSTTAISLHSQGLQAEVNSPMSLGTLIDAVQPFVKALGDTTVMKPLIGMSDLTMIDTLREALPPLKVDIDLHHGSILQPHISRTGLDFERVTLAFASDTTQTTMQLDVSMPELKPQDSTGLRLPASQAGLQINMTEGKTDVSLAVDSKVTDGAMSLHNLRTRAALRFDLARNGRDLRGGGRLTLDEIGFDSLELGRREIDIAVSPSEQYANAIKAEVQLEDIPLSIVDSFVQLKDLDIKGAIRAQAVVDGLPKQTDISAKVHPLDVAAEYTPYKIRLSLGEEPIIMEHNKVHLRNFSIYGADSTYLSMNGHLDLDAMRLDMALAADSFVPVKLEKGGPIPVYGEFAADIHGTVTGPLDSIEADVAVAILPNTDLTYPISKKNLAQVKPHGQVTAHYGVADGDLRLGGRINVDDGFIRYSPQAYPIMPFHVDSGSHIAFNGPVGKTWVDVSASQKVKASTQSEGEAGRMVDFRTGVRVKGEVDSIGLDAISFFLEAPKDEQITNELAEVDENTREGLAAALLATGMYLGESNASAHQEGYALTSILNSRINAALENSKRGKVIDIDVSSTKGQHASGESNDFNVTISKSFFKDRLRLAVGASVSDNPDVTSSAGFLYNASAEYKLTKDGALSLRMFSHRDYNNVLEGELIKCGLGLRTTKEWEVKSAISNPKSIIRRQLNSDSITRIYGLVGDADIVWRSNNSLGPNLTLTSSVGNLLGKGETFQLKLNGAYYWALRNRHPGDPKKTDTYKLGATASLMFPYLHWLGTKNPAGSTRYMLGYQYENIAGGYGVHKLFGSFTYFIRPTRYITHAFTPFSLSVVLMKAESEDLLNKVEDYPQLIKVLAGDEFIPSIAYAFTYSDYVSKRGVNTLFNVGIKEAGNIINGLYCAFGYKWSDQKKPLGSITYNQFVKLNVELRNKFNFTDDICIATRLYAGANIPLGNSSMSPLSEAFYTGGPNSMRATSPYAYGPGNFYSEKYNQNFFHAGDVKLEANFEFRFPIVWKLYGAAFVDAGNVWDWTSANNFLKEAGIEDYVERLQLREELRDGILDNPDFAKQIALGTGTGLRLDISGLVIRLDLGVAIHAPYLTYKYDKDRKPDKTQPITTYFNIPSALDALRLNFGIGYPF